MGAAGGGARVGGRPPPPLTPRKYKKIFAKWGVFLVHVLNGGGGGFSTMCRPCFVGVLSLWRGFFRLAPPPTKFSAGAHSRNKSQLMCWSL